MKIYSNRDGINRNRAVGINLFESKPNSDDNQTFEQENSLGVEKEPWSWPKAIAFISIAYGIIGLIFFRIPVGVVALTAGFLAYNNDVKISKVGMLLGLVNISISVILFVIT